MARVALFKGGLVFLAVTRVIAQSARRVANPVLPAYAMMGIFRLAGLAANGICLFLLWRNRHEDIDMSPVYEYSGNDVAVNLLVIVTGVRVFESGWPDILVASAAGIRVSARVIRVA